MVVLMLVEVVAEFKTMRQYLAMRKLGSVPDFFRGGQPLNLNVGPHERHARCS